MLKKAMFLIITILMTTGCFTDNENLDSGLDSTNTGIDQNKIIENETSKRNVYSVATENQDNSIVVDVISGPSETTSNRRVTFQYAARQPGYDASDFEYTYELRAGNTKIETLEVSDPDYRFTDEIMQTFFGLEYGTSYTFQVWARNKVTGKVSPSTIENFEVDEQPPTTTESEDVNLEYIDMNKMTVGEGEELEVTMSIKNSGNQTLEISPSVVFNSVAIYHDTQNQNSRFTSLTENTIQTIEPGDSIKVNRKYRVQTGTLDGSRLSATYYVLGKVNVLTTGKETLSKNKKFTVFSEGRLAMSIREVSVLRNTVTPGETNIRIRYEVTTHNNAEILLKNITPVFTTIDGTDVSSEWSPTGTQVETNVMGVAFETRTYSLSSQATPGDVLVDAKAEGIGENNVEIIVNNAEVGDKITVLDKGIANMELWIAYPEGATDGVVSKEQEFTVYGIVKYDGTVSFSEVGEVELDIDNLDGVRLTTGNSRQSINMNKQMEWTLKASSIPINGEIRLKVNRYPVDRVTESRIKFESELVSIPLRVTGRPEIRLETGIDENNYGGIDDVVRDDSEFTVYAIPENIGDGEVVGNARISLNLERVEGLILAPGERIYKDVAANEKATWKLRTPIGNRVGFLEFNLDRVPKDVNTGEEADHRDSDTLKINITQPGYLNLTRVYSDWEAINPGKSAVPIKFDIVNDGHTAVKVTDVKAMFYQKNVDVSDRWTLQDTSIRNDTIIEGKTTRTIIAYYNLRENLLDGTDIFGEVKISGEVKGEEVISEEIVDSLLPRYDSVITINDTIPPVAVINASATEVKVGEEIMFDGSESSDNDEMRTFVWNFNARSSYDIIARGKIVSHTYDRPGIYDVTLSVNDKANNGPTVETITIIVTEDEE